MNDGPTDLLRQEHELVLMVAAAMDREAADIERTGRVHGEQVAQMIDFTRNFTDGCHHSKEERLLFPMLEERSAAAGGPVSVMLSEHQAGRDIVRAISDALPAAGHDPAARAGVAEHLALYARLLRLHINKEESVLFPLAESMLSDQEQEMLAADFARVDQETSGPAVHERYHALAHLLATPPSTH